MKIIYLFILVLLAQSCINRNVNAPTEARMNIANELYTLRLEAKSFMKLKSDRKVVLSFTFDSDGRLILKGWIHKIKTSETQDDFEDKADITLNAVSKLNLALDSETVFNNIILRKGLIEKVQKNITDPKNQWIVFTPEYLPGLKNLRYKIAIVDKNRDPKLIREIGEMNPSPPKHYNLDN